MHAIDMIQAMHRHGIWANEALLQSAASHTDEQLDRAFDMGVGSLRRTLIHIYNGEFVWLQRWQGKAETKWPSEDEKTSVVELGDRFRQNAEACVTFLCTTQPGDFSRVIVYRDSKGRLFQASLIDMILQGFAHSTHHRAQAVNMIRRLGGTPPELDYMVWVRKPV
ncbi:MAG: DinB family protein [Planctomycetota bacterium]